MSGLVAPATLRNQKLLVRSNLGASRRQVGIQDPGHCMFDAEEERAAVLLDA